MMNRRDFLELSATAPGWMGRGDGILGAHGEIGSTGGRAAGLGRRVTFALDGNRVRYFCPFLKRPVTVVAAADTHLFMDDERGAAFRQYSGRMAKAYNETKHYQTGKATNPNEGFRETLKTAVEAKADLLALVGDIFSFPSEAAVDWVQGELKGAGVRYGYVAGNHDWHYEGMPGSLDSLRSEWIERRLKPMYQGRDPMASVVEAGGVRFLFVDNSQYEILPEQLAFFRAQVRSGAPLFLFVHIPLYAPGRGVGFGCGHPEWGAASDKNFELERRPRWPAGGHTRTTLQFHREVFRAPTLIGVWAGHIHRASLDVVGGVPQVVTDANATGASMTLEFLPTTAGANGGRGQG